jgi:CRISPR type IV-associated protein Csf2
VALFGGAMGNQIMPGKAKIGKAIPICKETAHLLPERFVDQNALEGIWELCQEESYTRRDDEKSEKLRQLITPQVRAMLEDKAAAQREKAGTDEDVAEETGQKQQMRYHVETLAAGTQLFWDITLDDVTDLEFEAFCVTLAQFARFPYVGGKSGVGHGKVEVHFDRWIEINPRLAPTGCELGFSLGNCYKAHLEQHASDIRSLLDDLV